MDADDKSLLCEFVGSSSEDAFVALVTRHAGLVTRIVQSRICDWEARKDVVQTVFCLMARKAKNLAEHPSIAGWLVKTAIFESKKYLRAESNRMKRESLHYELAEQDGARFTHEQFALVDEGVAALPEKFRTPLLMRYYEGKPFRVIAKRIGKSEGASQKLVSCAAEKLKAIVEKRSPGFGSAATISALLTAAFTPKAGAASGSALALAALQSWQGVSSVALVSNTFYTMTATQLKVGVAVALAALVPITLQWNTNRQLRARLTELESSPRTLAKLGDGRFPSAQTWRNPGALGLGKQQPVSDATRIPTEIANIYEKFGIRGKDFEQGEEMKRALGDWYLEDPQAALAWATSLNREQDKHIALFDFIDAEAERDFAAAVALLEELKPQMGRFGIRASLFQKATQDADSFLRICMATMGPLEIDPLGNYENTFINNDTSSISSRPKMAYPDGFDFESVLNTLAAAQSAAGEGQGFTTIPNLVRPWAAVDPQAALDWVLLGKEVRGNNLGVSSFIDGYRRTASDAEMGEFAAALFEAQSDEIAPYNHAWSALKNVEDRTVIQQFVNKVSDVEGNQEVLVGLIREAAESVNWTYDNNRAQRATLISMMEPEARYKLFVSEAQFHKPRARESLRPLLQRLGHSQEEIEQMLAER